MTLDLAIYSNIQHAQDNINLNLNSYAECLYGQYSMLSVAASVSGKPGIDLIKRFCRKFSQSFL
jgi:hypothetical protein